MTRLALAVADGWREIRREFRVQSGTFNLCSRFYRHIRGKSQTWRLLWKPTTTDNICFYEHKKKGRRRNKPFQVYSGGSCAYLMFTQGSNLYNALSISFFSFYRSAFSPRPYTLTHIYIPPCRGHLWALLGIALNLLVRYNNINDLKKKRITTCESSTECPVYFNGRRKWSHKLFSRRQFSAIDYRIIVS